MKIFGIGLNKTGTTSLHKALRSLGFHSLHYGGPDSRGKILRAEAEGLPLLTYVGEGFDAYLDINPIVDRFDLIDQQYPGSKFILTTRTLDAWLESRRKHVLRNQQQHAHGDYRGQWLTVDVDAWRAAWESHHERVVSYFRDRPSDLLILDVCAGEGYEKLCPFLGLDVPESTSFPWANATRGKISPAHSGTE